MLDTVELLDRAKDRVGGYSHGMRQRLGIAASLLRRPQLLLLDEPATGLDPAGMRDMRALVRRLADDGMTVVLSSHLMSEVEELCNRVAIISGGRIIRESTLRDLLASAAGSYRLDDDRQPRAPARSAGSLGVSVAPSRTASLVFARRPRRGRVGCTVALGKADVGIYSLVAEGASLERLFLELTDGDARHGRGRVMGGALVVYRWELRKLLSPEADVPRPRRRDRSCRSSSSSPSAVQNGQPNDVAFGRYVRESGLAIPLVLLLFGSIWLFPLITALVAGDIIASEHHNGTLKTIFTRSLDRGQIFAGQGGRPR